MILLVVNTFQYVPTCFVKFKIIFFSQPIIVYNLTTDIREQGRITFVHFKLRQYHFFLYNWQTIKALNKVGVNVTTV